MSWWAIWNNHSPASMPGDHSDRGKSLFNQGSLLCRGVSGKYPYKRGKDRKANWIIFYPDWGQYLGGSEKADSSDNLCELHMIFPLFTLYTIQNLFQLRAWNDLLKSKQLLRFYSLPTAAIEPEELGERALVKWHKSSFTF